MKRSFKEFLPFCATCATAKKAPVSATLMAALEPRPVFSEMSTGEILFAFWLFRWRRFLREKVSFRMFLWE